MSQFFASGSQSIGVSASASVLPMNIQDWFPLGWTDWISLQAKSLLSHVLLFAIPLTVAYLAPPSMEFFRQEYWSGLPFPSPGDISDPGIKPRSPSLQADSLPTELWGKPITNLNSILKRREILWLRKVHIVKTMVFPIVMYGCESWTTEELMLLICGAGEYSWESFGLQGDQTSPS